MGEYQQHVMSAMDKIMKKDNGRLALYTKERDDQEIYFEGNEEPEDDEDKP